MKLRLINHPQYYLLVDEESEIKEGYTCLNKNNRVVKALMDYRDFEPLIKIIAHLPKLNVPKLEGVALDDKLKTIVLDFSKGQLDLSVEVCPKCAEALIEKWSGVKCSNDKCDYQFCF